MEHSVTKMSEKLRAKFSSFIEAKYLKLMREWETCVYAFSTYVSTKYISWQRSE